MKFENSVQDFVALTPGYVILFIQIICLIFKFVYSQNK
jgi:hypothetical protein